MLKFVNNLLIDFFYSKNLGPLKYLSSDIFLTCFWIFFYLIIVFLFIQIFFFSNKIFLLRSFFWFIKNFFFFAFIYIILYSGEFFDY